MSAGNCEFLCPKSRTREAGGRVVGKLSMRLRWMRRRVLDGSRPEVKLCGSSLAKRGELLASCLRRFAADMRRIALASGGEPALTSWAREGAKVGGQHLTGDDGDGAASCLRWLAGCCSKICRQRCWMGEQPGRLHCRPQAAGSIVWPSAYPGTGTAELV